MKLITIILEIVDDLKIIKCYGYEADEVYGTKKKRIREQLVAFNHNYLQVFTVITIIYKTEIG